MTVFSKVQWHILSAALSDGLREFATLFISPVLQRGVAGTHQGFLRPREKACMFSPR